MAVSAFSELYYKVYRMRGNYHGGYEKAAVKGDKKDDTDEYLRMTVDAVNNTLEMYNATRSLVQEHSDIDEAEVNAAVSTLGTALKSGVDDAKADALDGMKKFIQAYGEAAKNITAA